MKICANKVGRPRRAASLDSHRHLHAISRVPRGRLCHGWHVVRLAQGDSDHGGIEIVAFCRSLGALASATFRLQLRVQIRPQVASPRR